MIDHERLRFGSARFCREAEARRAGLFRRKGVHLGFWGKRPLRLENDAPLITIAGARSGKGRDCLIYNACAYPGSMLIHDAKREIAPISIGHQITMGKAAWVFDPLSPHGHAVDPLDILDRGSASYDADVKLITEMLITLSGAAQSAFFELRAREWFEAIKKELDDVQGSCTLPALFAHLNRLEASEGYRGRVLARMKRSHREEVRRVAGEMEYKRKKASGEYSGIWAEIFKSLAFLNDRAAARSLSRSDFSLSALCDPHQRCNIYLNIPAEYGAVWAPLRRLLVGVGMLYKFRNVGSPRVVFLVDEAAQLGNFEMLLTAISYGPGSGLRTWCVYQDAGQITRAFGREALQGFLGSSQTRQFFGVRDLETATMVSQMLGTTTLSYDDPLQQMRDAHKARMARRSLLESLDPFALAIEAAHYERASRERKKQARALMTPDEVMNSPEHKQLLFISGKNTPPIYADKFPYWTRKDMAGTYLGNPYHPPVDRVSVQTWRGAVSKPVITEKVPARLASWPQYVSGEWSYVKGYKPNIARIKPFKVAGVGKKKEQTRALPDRPGEPLALPWPGEAVSIKETSS